MPNVTYQEQFLETLRNPDLFSHLRRSKFELFIKYKCLEKDILFRRDQFLERLRKEGVHCGGCGDDAIREGMRQLTTLNGEGPFYQVRRSRHLV
jgi:hypothetical protein